jgi:hypothetical protein
MRCGCCIELIRWHPSVPGRLCLTARFGHRYRWWPPTPAPMKTQCVLSVDVMAGLTTTLKAVMSPLRSSEHLAAGQPGQRVLERGARHALVDLMPSDAEHVGPQHGPLLDVVGRP